MSDSHGPETYEEAYAISLRRYRAHRAREWSEEPFSAIDATAVHASAQLLLVRSAQARDEAEGESS